MSDGNIAHVSCCWRLRDQVEEWPCQRVVAEDDRVEFGPLWHQTGRYRPCKAVVGQPQYPQTGHGTEGRRKGACETFKVGVVHVELVELLEIVDGRRDFCPVKDVVVSEVQGLQVRDAEKLGRDRAS